MNSIGETGYAYSSNAVIMDATCHVTVVVHGVDNLEPPAAPDTATVDIRAFLKIPVNRGAPFTTSAPVQMRFAPLGRPVERTQVNLSLDIGQ